MRKELFINDQLVDLPENFKIGLNFGCSDVSNLNNINSDYSTTIKLPNTTNNNRIIELSCYPVSGSLLPYNFVSARYYVNGVPIFEKGKAVIMEQSDGISINLFWSTFEQLKTLEGLKLTDLSITESFVNGYRSTLYNGTYLQQLIADFGSTFTRGYGYNRRNRISGNRFFPTYKVKPIFDLIFGGSSNYTIPAAVATHLATVRMATATMKGNATTTAAAKIETRHGAAGISNLVPLGNSRFVLHFLDTAYKISDTLGLVRTYDYEGDTNIPANAAFMAAPAKGQYRVHGSLSVFPDAFESTSEYVHIIMRIVGLKEGSEQPDELTTLEETIFIEIDFGERTSYPSGYPVLIEFDESFTLSGYCQTLRVEFDTTTNIPVDRTKRPVLGDFTGVWGAYLTRVNIAYYDAANNVGFLMSYPAKENLPDMNQKDFVKSIMQLYGLMMVIKNDKPYLFRFNEVIANKSIAKDWTEKLVNNKNQLIPSKMEFDLGVGKSNYLKYAKDEAVKGGIGRGTIASNYSIVDSVDIVQQGKFAASEENSISDGYKEIRSILMQQFENKDNKITFAGKAKPRLGFVYSGDELTFDYSNTYNEDGFDQSITADKSFRFTGSYPSEGVNYSFDLRTFYSGYTSVILNGKKLTLKFRLNSIDLHEFDYTIPIWLSQVNRFYFVKKITNWDIGVDCEVELIQLP